ncbi:MAG: metallophosphoesterase [Chloroflexota bacterium]
MNILAVSDIELGFIYNVQIAQRFKNVDLVISCGDLPYYYLEFIISMLDRPLYYVRGNHASRVEITTAGERHSPWGAVDLHRRVVRSPQGVLLAGIEGSLRYNYGPHQYSQAEMWWMVLGLTPALMLNKLRFGRFLDIFVTHAPPWGIHDMDDLPHRGIKAFNWLIKVFQPVYHLHGHIHVYRNDTVVESRVGNTTVVNCYGYREIQFNPQQVNKPLPEVHSNLGRRIRYE